MGYSCQLQPRYIHPPDPHLRELYGPQSQSSRGGELKNHCVFRERILDSLDNLNDELKKYELQKQRSTEITPNTIFPNYNAC
jgi:hypothetical protein